MARRLAPTYNGVPATARLRFPALALAVVVNLPATGHRFEIRARAFILRLIAGGAREHGRAR